jgi:transcriptional regulator with XRE-family HTH domain
MGIGDLIRSRRQTLGWSQSQLADELCRFRPSVTRDEVKKWEREKVIPGSFWLGHLASVLDMPLPEIEAAANLSRMKRRAFLAATGMTALSSSFLTDLMTSTAGGDFTVMRDYLTPYAVDLSMANLVRKDRGTTARLLSWMRDGETPKLRVNAGSILWKTGHADLMEAAARQLSDDQAAREWYLKGYARRVLHLPWDEAGTYTGRDMSARDLQAHSRNLSDHFDAGTRWCAAVVLGQAVRTGNREARDVLTSALRTEPVVENVRLIGLSLAGAQPWKER